jgi:putative DNA primase/helicase
MNVGRVERVRKSGSQIIFDADSPKPAKTAAHSAIMRRFSEIKAETLKWLWPGRIPLGKLTLLIGDPGLGKSLLTIDIAARVSRGSSFPDGERCEGGDVIFLSAEDDVADTIRPRLDAAGADVARVHILEGVRVTLIDNSIVDRPFNLETEIAALEDALTRIPGVRLIIIDPISAYLGGADSNTNAEVRELLSPLAALAAKYGVAIVCVTHLRKSAGAAVHRAIASIAFTAAARAVLAVASDSPNVDRRLMLMVKLNLGPSVGGLAFRIETQNALPRINWEAGAVAVNANDVLNMDYSEDHSERKDAEQWLREYLKDGAVGAREAIRAASDVGITKSTLWRAANSLGVLRRKLGGRGAGWEWSLEESKTSGCIHTPVDSLDSWTNQAKTRVDNGTKSPKISAKEDRGNMESLHLSVDREEKGEIRALSAGPVTCGSPQCAGCYEVEQGVRIHPPKCGEEYRK